MPYFKLARQTLSVQARVIALLARQIAGSSHAPRHQHRTARIHTYIFSCVCYARERVVFIFYNPRRRSPIYTCMYERKAHAGRFAGIVLVRHAHA